MTTFLRLLSDKDKSGTLLASCTAFRHNENDTRIFSIAPELFRAIPGAPFAYWVSDNIRASFKLLPAFDGVDRIARVTNPAGDDTRFVRAWWEISTAARSRPYRWVDFSKGGTFSPYFSDIHLVVCWNDARQTYHGFTGTEHRPLEKPACVEHFFRPGLTWPRRTKSRLSMRVMPKGCIFGDKGPAAFVSQDDTEVLLALLSVCSSASFYKLVEVQLAAADEQLGGAAHSFEVGIVQKMPVPDLSSDLQNTLAALARRAWSRTRTLNTIDETSHAFVLPAALRARIGDYSPLEIEADFERIQAEIDTIALDLYGFSEADRIGSRINDATTKAATEAVELDADPDDEDDNTAPVDSFHGVLSWAVGVCFGRFDWRLATGERAAPPEPDPFDPLPAKSPGMLPVGAEPFHPHLGILVDDRGHPHDLVRLLEEVLVRVETPVPPDVRRWLQRDFFPVHLQRYSKSRRKAPIYWPLSTRSGDYTLWVYYPSLTDQTLYTAVNDFIEPKRERISSDLTALRNKSNVRSRDDDKVLEALQALEKELIELRDTLLQITPTYRPDHDDGVQITAAPLWPVFRHKPWQKLLKESWGKLEKGHYDWSHLAMAYWPERVREKCKTDKSLAIAHGLEELYEPPPESATGPSRGGRKRRGAAQ
jgi:hypothetical protein